MRYGIWRSATSFRKFRGSRFVRITSQRHCYNLCESRAGLAALIAAARGYAFSCRTGFLAGRRGTPCLSGSTTQTIAAQESGAYGDEGKAVGGCNTGGFAV